MLACANEYFLLHIFLNILILVVITKVEVIGKSKHMFMLFAFLSGNKKGKI